MWALAMLLACRSEVTAVISGLDSGIEPTECFAHAERQVGELTCTLIEQEDATPILWYGRDVGPDDPLEIRLRTSDTNLQGPLATAAEAWNGVLATAGVMLAYDVELVADPVPCRLDGIADLPEQVAGFCLATDEEWAAEVPEEHQSHAYVTRLNSPCDGTLRGSMTLLHPLWSGALTDQLTAKALGHLTSVVEIDAEGALMADHWDGATLPQDDYEGACAAYQYRDQETG